jgi:hypothetical protein
MKDMRHRWGEEECIWIEKPKGKRPLGRHICRIGNINILRKGSDIQLDRHRQIAKMHTDRYIA